MFRLPQPGKDNGTWGDILNDYLLQAHTNTGTIIPGTITTTTIAPYLRARIAIPRMLTATVTSQPTEHLSIALEGQAFQDLGAVNGSITNNTADALALLQGLGTINTPSKPANPLYNTADGQILPQLWFTLSGGQG